MWQWCALRELSRVASHMPVKVKASKVKPLITPVKHWLWNALAYRVGIMLSFDWKSCRKKSFYWTTSEVAMKGSGSLAMLSVGNLTLSCDQELIEKLAPPALTSKIWESDSKGHYIQWSMMENQTPRTNNKQIVWKVHVNLAALCRKNVCQPPLKAQVLGRPWRRQQKGASKWSLAFAKWLHISPQFVMFTLKQKSQNLGK